MTRKENIGNNVYFVHALETVIIKKTSTYTGRSGVSRKEDLRDHHPSNRPRECVCECYVCVCWDGLIEEAAEPLPPRD